MGVNRCVDVWIVLLDCFCWWRNWCMCWWWWWMWFTRWRRCWARRRLNRDEGTGTFCWRCWDCLWFWGIVLWVLIFLLWWCVWLGWWLLVLLINVSAARRIWFRVRVRCIWFFTFFCLVLCFWMCVFICMDKYCNNDNFCFYMLMLLIVLFLCCICTRFLAFSRFSFAFSRVFIILLLLFWIVLF